MPQSVTLSSQLIMGVYKTKIKNPKTKTHSQVNNSNFRLLLPHRSTQTTWQLVFKKMEPIRAIISKPGFILIHFLMLSFQWLRRNPAQTFSGMLQSIQESANFVSVDFVFFSLSLSWSCFDRVAWSDTSPVWNRPARKIALYCTVPISTLISDIFWCTILFWFLS